MKKTTQKEKGSEVEVKRESMVLALDCLDAASWNVHTVVKDNDPTIKGLTDSMRSNGLLHAVVVMPGLEGRYTIIDGHRRVQAAKIAGWNVIDCVVRDVDERAAMVMTVSANLQRLENDPIKEAEAFYDLKKNGATPEEIAASIGKDARYVIRRVKLTDLDKVWKSAAKEQTFTVDTLERISAYDKKVQVEAYKNCKYDLKNLKDWEESVSWRKIKRVFDSQTMELSGCPFAMKDCESCSRNTANHGCLFPDLEGNKFGTCTDISCYTKKWNESIDFNVEKLRKKGIKVKSSNSRWSIRGNVTSNKTKKNTVPYIVEESGMRKIYWGEAPSANDNVSDARTSEEIAAEKEAKRREKEERDAIKRATEWLDGWIKSKGKDLLIEQMRVGDSWDPVRVIVVAYLLSIGQYADRYGEVSSRRCATLAYLGVEDDPTDGLNRMVDAIERRCGEYAGEDVHRMFFNLLNAQIKEDASVDDFESLSKKLTYNPSEIHEDEKEEE